MKKRPEKRRKPSRKRLIVWAVAALVVVGAAGWWFWPEPALAPGGTPKLAVDRTEIDLGYLRFNTSAYAAFTITNRGDGLLRLEPGPVRLIEGC